MMGWPVERAWAEACRFGELSQQPVCPHDWHIRRCTHQLPLARHSSQPAMLSGSSVTWMLSRCQQLALIGRTSQYQPASADTGVKGCQMGHLVAPVNFPGDAGRIPGRCLAVRATGGDWAPNVSDHDPTGI